VKKGGAADKAGLQLGDELLSVNGYDADRQTFGQMMLFFRALRPVDTLELEVQRGSEVKKFTVAAEGPVQQQILDVTKFDTFWQLLRETHSDQEDPYRWSISSDGIGYLELPSFALTEETLNSMVAKMKSAKVIIVDLRSNPGGRFESLRKLTGHFDPRETKLADVVGRKGPVPMKIVPLKPQLTAPLFVLIDSRSASAAEIFAYHVRLTKRGVVIGDQSAGRLMDARILYEQAGSDALILYGIEVSTGKVAFPGGADFEGKGVQPDVMCLPSAQEIAAKHDTCRDLAFAKARKALATPKPKATTKRKKHHRAN
jgi:C-terminal processing protease CtpA/Prc